MTVENKAAEEMVQLKAKDLQKLLDKVEGLMVQNASLSERVESIEKKETRIIVFLGDSTQRKGIGNVRFALDDKLGYPTIEMEANAAVKIVESEIKDKTFNFCFPADIVKFSKARTKRLAEIKERNDVREARRQAARKNRPAPAEEPTIESGVDYLERANE